MIISFASWHSAAALALGLMSMAFFACTDRPVAYDSGLAIENVTVIDVVQGKARKEQTVIVEGNRIAKVAGASAVSLGEDVARVDGTGRYLIPGLWDMHLHFGMPFAREPEQEA